MRPQSLALALLSLVVVGCEDPLKANDGKKTGFIDINTYALGDDFIIDALGVFYDRSNYVVEVPTPGFCGIAPYPAPGTVLIPSLETLNAGAHLIVDMPTLQDTLYPANEFGLRLYRPPTVAGIPHVPGDTIRVTVPGGTGFPATTISDKSPDAFVFDQPGVPEVGEGLPIEWTPPTAAGSVMVFSLRYGTPTAVSGLPNAQVLCSFDDDGSAVIAEGFLSGWRQSTTERSTVGTRVRVREVEINSNVWISMITKYDSPAGPVPPPQ